MDVRWSGVTNTTIPPFVRCGELAVDRGRRQLLLDAGYPVKDASQEVLRIRAKVEQDAAMRIAENAAGRECGGDGSGDQGRGAVERIA